MTPPENDAPAWTGIRQEPPTYLNTIDEVIRAWAKQHPERVRVIEGPIVFVASDYAGSHKNSRYEVFSYLAVDYIFLWLWNDLRQEVRKTFLPNKRRMAFKGLNDAHKRAALVPFLRSANTLPGFLLSFAINRAAIKRIAADKRPLKGMEKWKPESIARLNFILSCFAIVVGGMVTPTAPSQHLFWITDEDAILPNDERAKEALVALARILEVFVPHVSGDVSWATARSDDETQGLEDLVAIPDLAGGALAELLTNTHLEYHDNVDGSFNVSASSRLECAAKTHQVLDWYAEPGHPLQRLAIVIDEHEDSTRIWTCDLAEPGKHSPAFDTSMETLIRIAEAHGVLDEIRAGLDHPSFIMPKTKFDNQAMLDVLNTLRHERVTFGSEFSEGDQR